MTIIGGVLSVSRSRESVHFLEYRILPAFNISKRSNTNPNEVSPADVRIFHSFIGFRHLLKYQFLFDCRVFTGFVVIADVLSGLLSEFGGIFGVSGIGKASLKDVKHKSSIVLGQGLTKQF